MRLRIALDIDDTLADFVGSYNNHFNTNLASEPDWLITKNVRNLRYNKKFWLGLEKIEWINFTPEIYCTKRINPKSYSRQWLLNNGFPDKPIYQMIYQRGNKADMIKGRCDVLIDDSVSNVRKCIQSGLPALLIDRPHNRYAGPECRIYSLDIDEIIEAYKILNGRTNFQLERLGWNRYFDNRIL